ncbi:MAG: AraC family transcriptional regulator [bacterium]
MGNQHTAGRLATLYGDTQLFLWNGGCLFIGNWAARFAVHAHQAIQICAGSSGELRLRPTDDDAWTSYELAIIPSRQPHAFDATEISQTFVLFVEPETREGRALTELYLAQGIASLDRRSVAESLDTLFTAFRARSGDAAVTLAARGLVGALTRGVDPSEASDDRILRAIAYVNSHLDRAITLDQVASEACLSPDRFRHLFVEQTGMGLRPFILWRRFMLTWQLLMDGVVLSHVAHRAGFADSAHLSRTCKRMIGVAPSMFRVSANPAALTRPGQTSTPLA